MAKITLGTTPQQVPVTRRRPIIQNLGPGSVYFDVGDDVSADTGIKLSPGMIYEFSTAGAHGKLWIVASQSNTDVRVIEVG